MEPQTKSERLSLSLRPLIAERVRSVTENVNEYLEDLIVADLLARGAVTEEELKDAIYGSAGATA